MLKAKCGFGMCADDEEQAGEIEFLVLSDVNKKYPHWVGVCACHADGWYEGCGDNLDIDVRNGLGPCYEIRFMARNDWAVIPSHMRSSLDDAVAKSKAPVSLSE